LPANHAITDPQHPNSAEMPVNATLPVDEALGPDAPEPYRSSSTDPGRPVREFEAICAKHNLACGAPENLVPFLGALTDNKLLAMNFWSVVARLSDGRHGPALSQDQILAAIVQAVTGQSKDNIGPAQQEPIAQLGRMLAGEDVATSHPAAAPEEPRSSAAAPQQPSAAPDEPPRDDRRSSVTQRHPDTAERASDTPPEVAAPSSPRSSIRSRLVLTPDLSRPHAETHQRPLQHRSAPLRTDPEPDEPRISIPLSAYADQDDARSPARWLGVVVLTLILLGGAALFLLRGVTAWRQPGNTVQQAFASFAQSTAATFHRVRDAIHGSSTAAHTAVSSGPALPSASNPEAAPATPAAVAPPQATNNPTADRYGASAPAPTAPAYAGTPSRAPSPAIYSSRNASRSLRPADRTPADSAVTADDAARDAALTQVSGSEMRSHLFASRFPIVPDAINADAVSGVVTLHAVITARGTVEHIYAISGPPALRQAAIDAVSGWRYRPYMLNGQPIDVSTTIRVDFSGNL
jgi:outer membrane biosynthesis protein TonB